MAKKFYVVWKGRETGVFDSWSKVQSITSGMSDAQFMGFASKQAAEKASKESYTKALMKRSLSQDKTASGEKVKPVPNPKTNHACQIYTDGACSPNPGKSGTGVALYQHGKATDLWFGLYAANGTNNTAELNGLLMGMKLAQKCLTTFDHVEILSDSKYGIDSLTKWASGWEKKGWKKANGEPVKNPELIKSCYQLYKAIKKQITITHVAGHADIEGNELADRMAVHARKEKTEGFERFSKPFDVQTILKMESG